MTVTDPRWPAIRFSGSETAALVEVFRTAALLGCDAARSGDPDGEPCIPCQLGSIALYASPAVYAQLEPDLPRPPAATTTKESPF